MDEDIKLSRLASAWGRDSSRGSGKPNVGGFQDGLGFQSVTVNVVAVTFRGHPAYGDTVVVVLLWGAWGRDAGWAGNQARDRSGASEVGLGRDGSGQEIIRVGLEIKRGKGR